MTRPITMAEIERELLHTSGLLDRVEHKFFDQKRQILQLERLLNGQPGGLKTQAQAALKLNCSIKTLKAHVEAGELKYVTIGHGKKRPRKMFTDADLDEFVAVQTRKDVSACPSDVTHVLRSINTTSKSNVTAFSDLQKRRPGVRPKQ